MGKKLEIRNIRQDETKNEANIEINESQKERNEKEHKIGIRKRKRERDVKINKKCGNERRKQIKDRNETDNKQNEGNKETIQTQK